MIEIMKKDIEFLKKWYGNHSAAAKGIGISPEHYRRLRNQDIGSHVLRKLISMKVSELKMIREISTR
jgi:hypothetical protein